VLEVETGPTEDIEDVTEIGIKVVMSGILGEREGVNNAFLVITVAKRNHFKLEVIDISPSVGGLGVISIDVVVWDFLDDMIASSSWIGVSSLWGHAFDLGIKRGVNIVAVSSDHSID